MRRIQELCHHLCFFIKRLQTKAICIQLVRRLYGNIRTLPLRPLLRKILLHRNKTFQIKILAKIYDSETSDPDTVQNLILTIQNRAARQNLLFLSALFSVLRKIRHFLCFL